MTTLRTCRAALAGVVAVMSLAWVAPVAAQQADEPTWEDSFYPFGRVGPYFGLGALYALENFDTNPPIDAAGSPTSIDGQDGGGLWIRGGYRLHSRIAAELMFQYYWGFEVEGRDSLGETIDDQFNGWTLTANAKLYPFLGRFQPYAVAGFGGLVFDQKQGDDAGFVARMGGGMDVYISDSFVVDFEAVYLFPGGDISEFQFATFALGVQYRY